MVIVLAAILVAMMPAGFLLRKSKNFYWYTGILLGWVLCVCSFLMFIAKNAGYSYYTNRLLFVLDSIRVHLLYLPLTSSQVTFLQIIGRSVFLFCLLGYATQTCHQIKSYQRTFLIFINGILCITNSILYIPYFYRRTPLSEVQLQITANIIRIWAVLVMLITAYLLILEYHRTTFRWFRSRLAYINYGILGTTSFWAYVVLRGPIQYLEPRTFFHMYQRFNYYDPPISPLEWLIWEIVLVIVVILSLHSFVQYSHYHQQLQNDNTRLNNTMMFSRNGISMLGHAMKNHLISTGISLEDALQYLGNRQTDQAIVLIRQAIEQNQIMLNRLNRLSASVKQRELDLRPVHLYEILEKIARETEIPDNICFKLTMETPSIVLLADEQALSESIKNILINAIEAIHSAPGNIQISQSTETTWCLIRISDDGPGMNAIQLEKIFDPFYSSKNSSSNWGMGLSFAHQTVAAHGGILEATSVLRKGSTFTLALPLAR